MVRQARIGVIALLAVSLGCPSTRLRPIGATPGEFKPADDEAYLWIDGRLLDRSIEDNGLVYEDSSLEAYVTAVARRVAAPSLDSSTFTPRVRIVRHPLLNAFALPHGVIYVHTGVLARMENEAQLATILGRELTHITHRHAIRQLREARNKRAFAEALSTVAGLAGTAALGSLAGTTLGTLTGSMGDLFVMTAVKGYARELETEADEGGLAAMIRAGYDPCEAPKIFRHLQESFDDSRFSEVCFYGTYDRVQIRLGNYLLKLGQRCSGASADSSPTRASPYQERMATLVLDNALLDLQIGRVKTAEAGVRRHLAVRPANPRGHLIRGEIERRQGREQEAIAAYEEAGRLDPLYAEPHRELGLLYRLLGRPDEARAALRRYLELSPTADDAAAIEELLAELEPAART